MQSNYLGKNIQESKYKIEFSNTFIYEVEETYNYILWRLLSEINANHFLEKIFSKFEILRFNPYIYPLLLFQNNLNYKYRKIPIDNFMIFYTILEKEKIVRISHIYYAKSNYGNRLF